MYKSDSREELAEEITSFPRSEQNLLGIKDLIDSSHPEDFLLGITLLDKNNIHIKDVCNVTEAVVYNGFREFKLFNPDNRYHTSLAGVFDYIVTKTFYVYVGSGYIDFRYMKHDGELYLTSQLKILDLR